MRLLLLQLPQYIQNIYIYLYLRPSVQITNCIHQNQKICFSKLPVSFVQIEKCICLNCCRVLSHAPFPLPRTNESAAAPPIYIRRCTQHCTAIHYYALYCALQCTAVICSMIILQICAWMKHTFCNNIAQISTDSPSVELIM